MTTEELYALASEIAAEELIGDDDQPISTDEVFLVLEALWQRGMVTDER